VDKKLQAKIQEFVKRNIVDFHTNRLRALDSICLPDLIGNKNPYLFRAKNLNLAHDLIDAVLSARLSSSEEGTFGNFLESLAIFVAEVCGDGKKSGIEGIDLELTKQGTRYLVAVKSGKKWGNAQSQKKQREDFKKALQVLKQNKNLGKVETVLGICYGRFRTRHNGIFLHIGGQSFWHLLSDDPNLYVDIVEPLGFQAEKYDREFKERVSSMHNRLVS
jgi:hypothetical protein